MSTPSSPAQGRVLQQKLVFLVIFQVSTTLRWARWRCVGGSGKEWAHWGGEPPHLAFEAWNTHPRCTDEGVGLGLLGHRLLPAWRPPCGEEALELLVELLRPLRPLMRRALGASVAAVTYTPETSRPAHSLSPVGK